MRANRVKPSKIDQSDEFYFGYDAKQAFARAYAWASDHYKDWDERNSIATNTGYIVATILQEYINSKPKF